MTVFEYIIKLARLSVQNFCEFNHLHILFDNYIEGLIKEGERRTQGNCDHLPNLPEDVPWRYPKDPNVRDL